MLASRGRLARHAGKVFAILLSPRTYTIRSQQAGFEPAAFLLVRYSQAVLSAPCLGQWALLSVIGSLKSLLGCATVAPLPQKIARVAGENAQRGDLLDRPSSICAIIGQRIAYIAGMSPAPGQEVRIRTGISGMPSIARVIGVIGR